MRRARHLGGNGSERLAPEIRVVAIPRDVALVFGPEAVVALTNGNLGGDPEGAPQSRIAEFRQLRLAAELSGLVGREIEAAELQELTMITKATEIAGLGKYGHRHNRPDARDLSQALIVSVVCECCMSLAFDKVALPDQASSLSENEAKHGDRGAVERDR